MAVLHAEAFPHEPWTEDSFATLLAQPGVAGLLDEQGGMVLLRVAADEAEVLTIGVAGAARRRGVGRGLMGAALAEAKNRGAATMFLEVAVGNTAALGLYESLGFEAAGRRAAYYADGGDAVLLRRAL